MAEDYDDPFAKQPVLLSIREMQMVAMVLADFKYRSKTNKAIAEDFRLPPERVVQIIRKVQSTLLDAHVAADKRQRDILDSDGVPV